MHAERQRGWDARRVLLGDWSRLVRDPIDVLRLTFPIGAAAFALAGDSKAVMNLLIGTLATGIARAVNLPRIYDLSFVGAMIVTCWGEALGLYDALPWYDNLVHVLAPMFSAPVVYIGLARLEIVPDPRDETNGRHLAGIFLVTLSLGLAIGAIWEMVEYGSDGVLGSRLQTGNEDTVGDLVADGLGSLAGAALLVAWTTKGWGSVRRMPGTNRAEDTNA